MLISQEKQIRFEEPREFVNDRNFFFFVGRTATRARRAKNFFVVFAIWKTNNKTKSLITFFCLLFCFFFMFFFLPSLSLSVSLTTSFWIVICLIFIFQIIFTTCCRHIQQQTRIDSYTLRRWQVECANFATENYFDYAKIGLNLVTIFFLTACFECLHTFSHCTTLIQSNKLFELRNELCSAKKKYCSVLVDVCFSFQH